MHTAVVARPLDPVALLTAVAGASAGAAVLFVGTVRNATDGRAVSGLEYSAYLPMAERELAQIVDEAAERSGTRAIAVEHRVGPLEVGDASVVIAVSHAHRGPAYDASRYIIEELKRRLPVWKREGYSDGSREWVRAAESLAP